MIHYIQVNKRQKFGKLRIKEDQELSAGSPRKTEWVCDCGRTTSAAIRSVIIGLTKSCGKCNTILAAELVNRQFGHLRIKQAQDLFPRSMRKITWVCDCGRETDIAINSVLSGYTKSCGKCNTILAADIAERKYGKLKIKNPQDLTPGSHQIIPWSCDCGKECMKRASYVLSGKVQSCGKCTIISSEELASKKFGKLRAKDPVDTPPRSNKKLWWICDCGRSTYAVINSVTSGRTKSCGKCNLMTGAKFGNLTTDQEFLRGSGKSLDWKCACGAHVALPPYKVTSSHNTSCGHCRDQVHAWWLKNQVWLQGLHFPFDKPFPPGGIIPLEVIQNAGIPFRAQCSACGKEYHPRLSDIRRGRALTCGCTSHRRSLAAVTIAEYIHSLGVDAILEHDVLGLKYDIFVPSTKLLIEFNGLQWHSLPGSKERDIYKYQHAIVNHFQFMSIYEDEWRCRRDPIQNLITHKLLHTSPTGLRPSVCVIRPVFPSEANTFYDQFHYIGACRPKVSYGAFLQNRLIGCMSFSHPTRQSRHQWELVRMASDPAYRVHGIWSKLFTEFIRNQSPISVVSFSDNRLFSGGVYEKMGFRYDGEVLPDYYWIRNGSRYHKSAMRKTTAEKMSGLTEKILRENQGYRRIWDLGKKRWIWHLGKATPDPQFGYPSQQ